MRIKSMMVACLSAVIVFGGIFIANSMGFWQTESTKEPLKFAEGEFEGMPMPDDIRGSYSFKDIENAFGVDANIIAQAFNIQTEDPGSVKAKNIEEIYGDLGENVEIGTGAVKKFISLYTGLPYEGEDYLPISAIDVLKANGKLNDDMEASLDGYVLEISLDVDLDIADTTSKDEHVEEIKIKGKTTVADAISYGISLTEIEEIIGVEIDNKNMLIRDLCEQNGLSFSTVKDKLSEKLK